MGDAGSGERCARTDELSERRGQERQMSNDDAAAALAHQEPCDDGSVAVWDEAFVDEWVDAQHVADDRRRLGSTLIRAMPQARRACPQSQKGPRRRPRLLTTAAREGPVTIARGLCCFPVTHQIQIHARSVPTMTSEDNRSPVDPLDAFSLFCAYHLGLDRFGRRRFSTIHDVARAAGVSRELVDEALVRHGLDAAHMLERDFDLASAQLDIQASPPGVDLVSIAWMHWELWCAAPARDRAREAEDDARANARIFGGHE